MRSGWEGAGWRTREAGGGGGREFPATEVEETPEPPMEEEWRDRWGWMESLSEERRVKAGFLFFPIPGSQRCYQRGSTMLIKLRSYSVAVAVSPIKQILLISTVHITQYKTNGPDDALNPFHSERVVRWLSCAA